MSVSAGHRLGYPRVNRAAAIASPSDRRTFRKILSPNVLLRSKHGTHPIRPWKFEKAGIVVGANHTNLLSIEQSVEEPFCGGTSRELILFGQFPKSHLTSIMMKED